MQSRKKMLAAGATAAIMAFGATAPAALAQDDESLNVNALNDVADVSETLNVTDVANDADVLNGNSALNGNDTEALTAGDINAANGNEVNASDTVDANGNALDLNDTLDSVIGLE